MSRAAEVLYRREKIIQEEYQELITDEVWFLRLQVDWLVKLFKHDYEQAETILDAGAGTCWFAAHMKHKYSKDVLSLDISREVMGLSSELYDFEGPKFVGELRDLASEGREFSLICCSALIHHIEDLREFYDQISKLLCCGGLFIAFNEPRSPHFPPLKYLHRIWFGRMTRAYGLQELPRTIPEYLDSIPETLVAHVFVDYEKSRRNYEQMLGKWAACLYSIFNLQETLRRVRTNIFPEAIVITLRKTPVEGSPTNHMKFNSTLGNYKVRMQECNPERSLSILENPNQNLDELLGDEEIGSLKVRMPKMLLSQSPMELVEYE